MREPFRIQCRCAAVVLLAEGPPLLHICCYCDDCQAAAALIDALPGGCSGMLEDGGTPNVLFRRDQVRFASGVDNIAEYRLRHDSPTVRLVARCCNTAITQRHEQGWPHRGIKTHLIASPPPLEMRVFTRYAPDRARLPRDVPLARGPGARLVWKLIRARLAVGRAPLARP